MRYQRKEYGHECKECGSQFASYKADAKYCSLPCYGNALRLRADERNRKAEIVGKNYAALVNGKPVLLEHPSLMRCLESSSELVYDEWDGVTVVVGCR